MDEQYKQSALKITDAPTITAALLVECKKICDPIINQRKFLRKRYIYVY